MIAGRTHQNALQGVSGRRCGSEPTADGEHGEDAPRRTKGAERADGGGNRHPPPAGAGQALAKPGGERSDQRNRRGRGSSLPVGGTDVHLGAATTDSPAAVPNLTSDPPEPPARPCQRRTRMPQEPDVRTGATFTHNPRHRQRPPARFRAAAGCRGMGHSPPGGYPAAVRTEAGRVGRQFLFGIICRYVFTQGTAGADRTSAAFHTWRQTMVTV